MPDQLHSVTELDFQPDVALFPPFADWRDYTIYSLTPQMSPEQVQRSG